ncbi:hypothetical protein GCM10022409_45150 [Hymenobacter glaciei]|uniref:Capsule synthesis protein CapA domain-containing protein n=1 Tax=Hymenobacter glaciei TaxID=877209 RepID=A0ABP7UUE4_9BACT
MPSRFPLLAGILIGGILGGGFTACQPSPPAALRVSIVGDVLLARSVPAALARDSTALAHGTRHWWAGSRYVIGNLECPLTTHEQPAAKQFVFRAAPRWAGWLRRLGLTHVSLANNHTFDQHLAGLRDTDQAARAARLGTLGYQADSAVGCLPQLLGPDSSVAVLAYSTFQTGGVGEACVCGRDFARLCERLAAYKTLFPQRAVLVYLHWGTEYAGQPTELQQQQAHTLIDCGAAAVVGAHPHVVQTVAFYRGRPILYSLGNFLFDQSRAATDLALQADFDLRAGRVVATYLRPLQLVRALPRRADAYAQAALAARIRRYSPGIRLGPADAAGGWQLLPMSPTAADSLPGFLARRATVTGPAGAATVRLRALPHARQTQMWAPTAHGGYSTVDFRFPIYAFGAGDVDNDGYVDLLIGPTKPTRFDSAMHRRLFVYSLDSAGRLQPRWRGSRLTYRLLYFRTERGAEGHTYVRTLEQAPDGRYCIGRYHWQGFGLALDGFLARRQSLDAAYQCFVL